MDYLLMDRWSPYVVGAGIGVLSWLSFLISKNPIACSTTFAKTSGMIERLFRGESVALKPYYRKIGLSVDWQWMLVVGVVIGAFVSAWISGDFELTWVPSHWRETFGPDPVHRLLVSLAGGVFLGFGSRWSDGCTSGHGISGTLQLAVSSWISTVFFFVGGIIAAQLIFRVIAQVSP